MGAMLMTGLACLGATIAIALIATSTLRPVGVSTDPPTSRSLAIILLAFVQGVAVLGVVVGLLAIFAGKVPDPASGLIAAGPAVAGAIVGLVLVVRNRRASDPKLLAIGATYIVAPAMLGVVVALLANFVVVVGAPRLLDWPFIILGATSSASALAIGVTGARTIRSTAGVNEQTRKALTSAQISRCALFQAASFGASAVAILLVEVP
jgi:F0F1-type ATP synthase membrane subunit c/vacuolar-type H+-ATPase subunit K